MPVVTSWTRPSPCEGWTARDVVGHLVQTQRDFLTGRGFDLGLAADIDSVDVMDPAAAWRAHAAAVTGLLARPEVKAAYLEGGRR